MMWVFIVEGGARGSLFGCVDQLLVAVLLASLDLEELVSIIWRRGTHLVTLSHLLVV